MFLLKAEGSNLNSFSRKTLLDLTERKLSTLPRAKARFRLRSTMLHAKFIAILLSFLRIKAIILSRTQSIIYYPAIILLQLKNNCFLYLYIIFYTFYTNYDKHFFYFFLNDSYAIFYYIRKKKMFHHLLSPSSLVTYANMSSDTMDFTGISHFAAASHK